MKVKAGQYGGWIIRHCSVISEMQISYSTPYYGLYIWSFIWIVYSGNKYFHLRKANCQKEREDNENNTSNRIILKCVEYTRMRTPCRFESMYMVWAILIFTYPNSQGIESMSLLPILFLFSLAILNVKFKQVLLLRSSVFYKPFYSY